MSRLKPPKAVPMDLETAQTTALSALAFLAWDTQRFDRFVALTGLTVDYIRDGATNPELQAAVLAYMLQDESTLLMFAHNAGLQPEAIAAAHGLLAAAPPEG
jgi:hypothetical protein